MDISKNLVYVVYTMHDNQITGMLRAFSKVESAEKYIEELRDLSLNTPQRRTFPYWEELKIAEFLVDHERRFADHEIYISDS